MEKIVSSKWLVVCCILVLTMVSCSDDSDDGNSGDSSSSSVASSSSVTLSSSSSIASSSSEAVSSSSVEVSSSSVAPSSSSVASSSSVVLSSSSSVGVVAGTGCSIDGYNTVTIGTQTWMAENYNCAVSGSKCGNKSNGTLTENSADCNEYGRLYDWATAMNLPGSCNSTSCSDQVQAKHQGICPEGWYIPSNDDWDKLLKYVDAEQEGDGEDYPPYDSFTAGKHLKAASGWNSGGGGLDTYGFAALPGGRGYSGGSFNDAGDYGFWWSASEYYNNNANDAYSRDIYYNGEDAYWYNNHKMYLISLRCVKD